MTSTTARPPAHGRIDWARLLRRHGWTLGIATGKSDRGLAGLLDTHGLGQSFATLQTSDRHPSKPHPAMLEAALLEAGAMPEEAVMIGDTSFDMAMARAAGVRAIGVAWGYHGAEELLAAKAEPAPTSHRAALAMVYFAKGDKALGEAQLAEIIRLDADFSQILIADIYTLRGDADQAFAWLDRGLAARDPGVSALYEDPFLVPALRHDPRLAAIARKIGLPDPDSLPGSAAPSASPPVDTEAAQAKLKP